jgi:hypothetical protein
MAKARDRRVSKVTPPPKKRRLSEFQGMFPTSKPYIGVEGTRQEVARQLGEELERKTQKR